MDRVNKVMAAYRAKTDDEIATLARDYLDRKLWTNHQGMHAFAFIPYLSLEDKEDLVAFLEQDGRSGLIYQYMSKKSEDLVMASGIPTFEDMELLSPDDTERLGHAVAALERLKIN